VFGVYGERWDRGLATGTGGWWRWFLLLRFYMIMMQQLRQSMEAWYVWVGILWTHLERVVMVMLDARCDTARDDGFGMQCVSAVYGVKEASGWLAAF